MKIDFEQALETLSEAQDGMTELTGVEWTDPESWTSQGTANARKHKAAINKKLLHIQHLLELAKVEVAEIYWEGKGYE